MRKKKKSEKEVEENFSPRGIWAAPARGFTLLLKWSCDEVNWQSLGGILSLEEDLSGREEAGKHGFHEFELHLESLDSPASHATFSFRGDEITLSLFVQSKEPRARRVGLSIEFPQGEHTFMNTLIASWSLVEDENQQSDDEADHG